MTCPLPSGVLFQGVSAIGTSPILPRLWVGCIGPSSTTKAPPPNYFPPVALPPRSRSRSLTLTHAHAVQQNIRGPYI